jgi:hypothetical protein
MHPDVRQEFACSHALLQFAAIVEARSSTAADKYLIFLSGSLSGLAMTHNDADD